MNLKSFIVLFNRVWDFVKLRYFLFINFFLFTSRYRLNKHNTTHNKMFMSQQPLTMIRYDSTKKYAHTQIELKRWWCAKKCTGGIFFCRNECARVSILILCTFCLFVSFIRSSVVGFGEVMQVLVLVISCTVDGICLSYSFTFVFFYFVYLPVFCISFFLQQWYLLLGM